MISMVRYAWHNGAVLDSDDRPPELFLHLDGYPNNRQFRPGLHQHSDVRSIYILKCTLDHAWRNPGYAGRILAAEAVVLVDFEPELSEEICGLEAAPTLVDRCSLLLGSEGEECRIFNFIYFWLW